MAQKNPNLKKANSENEYEEHHLQELGKCSRDPVHFIKTYCQIEHPTKGVIPFQLYDYQEELVEAYNNHRNTIVLSARQTGKTASSAAYILWYASFKFNKTILIASNKNSNAMEIVHRIKIMYEHLPHWLKPGINAEEFNKHNMTFDNGSRIISTATTPESGRGLSISLLFLDEFAFVKPSFQDEFWTSIQPTLSTGGQCIITSTPNGDINLFAQLWRGANVEANDFHPVYVPWDAPPGRDEEFRVHTIKQLGLEKWKQEFLCQFISSDALLIDSKVLQILTKQVDDREVDTSAGGFNFWYSVENKFNPTGKMSLIVGIDPSTGISGDFSVIEAFEFPSMRQVAEFRSNVTKTGELYKILKLFLKHMKQFYSTIYFTIENNGIGEGLLALYYNDSAPIQSGDLVSEPGKNKLGMTTTRKSKERSCSKLKNMIETGTMAINSKLLLAELKGFGKFGNTLQAQYGSTDDCVSACLLVTRVIDEIVSFDQDAFELLNKTEDISKMTLDELSFAGDEEWDDGEPVPFTF